MALMQENLGLDFLNDPDTLSRFMAMVAQEGKTFPGYSGGISIFKDTGTCEFWMNTALDAETGHFIPTGFHTHGGNLFVWEMRHSGITLMHKSTPIMEHIGMFSRADGTGGMIPIEIINADVIPSLMEDDKITVQVEGFPLEINYFKDDEEYENSQSQTMNGRKWTLGKGSLVPLTFLGNHNPDTYDKEKEYPTDAYVHFAAEVTSLYHGVFELGDVQENTYIRCRVDTTFGGFELIHSIDQVPEEQRDNIRVGAIVSGVCIISGDVAINEYEKGAIKDFDHDLRLLRYVMAEGKADKLAGVLTDNTVYSSEASGKTVVGAKDIIDRLKYVDENKDQDYHVFLASITEADSEELKYPVGTRCLVLAAGEEDNYESIAFLSVNEDGNINTIEMSTDSRYHFQIDKVEKPHSPLDDLELPDSVAEAILLRAKYNGILDWDYDIDGFVEGIEDYHALEDPVKRMLEALKEDPQEDAEVALENVLGYLFAKAAEAVHNNGLPNPDMKPRLVASYSPDEAFHGVITSEDPSIQKKLEDAMEEGKRYFIDFKVHLNSEDEFEDLYTLAAVVVEKLGQIYGEKHFIVKED